MDKSTKLKLEKDNQYIKSIIEANNPFFIGRIAGCELKIANNLKKGNLLDLADDMLELENNAGIKVTNHESLQKYVFDLLESYQSCTVIAEWERKGKVFIHTGSGQELITQLTPRTPKIDARALEPYYVKDSWMPSLKGKKIQIIHPFKNTFLKQIEHFKEIFPNRSWFEDCELEFVKPPITFAGNHQDRDWQEHYQNFINELKNVPEFDIALVSAGGYGMLISNYIYKEMGKSVIYIGGALQLFFGVIGKRWFENNDILSIMNDHWIRPEKDDKPNNFQNVEKGCYW
jgi:hypothetical protein